MNAGNPHLCFPPGATTIAQDEVCRSLAARIMPDSGGRLPAARPRHCLVSIQLRTEGLTENETTFEFNTVFLQPRAMITRQNTQIGGWHGSCHLFLKKFSNR
jgi:hypothetical protein